MRGISWSSNVLATSVPSVARRSLARCKKERKENEMSSIMNFFGNRQQIWKEEVVRLVKAQNAFFRMGSVVDSIAHTHTIMIACYYPSAASISISISINSINSTIALEPQKTGRKTSRLESHLMSTLPEQQRGGRHFCPKEWGNWRPTKTRRTVG